jgi:hypothetical protein
MPRLELHELSFLDSVEVAHAALDTSSLVVECLGACVIRVRMGL